MRFLIFTAKSENMFTFVGATTLVAARLTMNANGEVYLLFDVQNDPSETHNLTGRPKVTEIEMALRLQILERLGQTQQNQQRL